MTTVRELIGTLELLPREAELCIDLPLAEDDGEISVINVDRILIEPFEHSKNMYLIFGEKG